MGPKVQNQILTEECAKRWKRISDASTAADIPDLQELSLEFEREQKAQVVDISLKDELVVDSGYESHDSFEPTPKELNKEALNKETHEIWDLKNFWDCSFVTHKTCMNGPPKKLTSPKDKEKPRRKSDVSGMKPKKDSEAANSNRRNTIHNQLPPPNEGGDWTIVEMKKSGSNLNSPHRQSSPVSPESKAKGKGKGKGKVKEGKAKGKGKEDALSPRTPATGRKGRRATVPADFEMIVTPKSNRNKKDVEKEITELRRASLPDLPDWAIKKGEVAGYIKAMEKLKTPKALKPGLLKQELPKEFFATDIVVKDTETDVNTILSPKTLDAWSPKTDKNSKTPRASPSAKKNKNKKEQILPPIESNLDRAASIRESKGTKKTKAKKKGDLSDFKPTCLKFESYASPMAKSPMSKTPMSRTPMSLGSKTPRFLSEGDKLMPSPTFSTQRRASAPPGTFLAASPSGTAHGPDAPNAVGFTRRRSSAHETDGLNSKFSSENTFMNLSDETTNLEFDSLKI